MILDGIDHSELVEDVIQKFRFICRSIADGFVLEHRKSVDKVSGRFLASVCFSSDRIGNTPQSHKGLRVERVKEEFKRGRRGIIVACLGMSLRRRFVSGMIRHFCFD